MSETEKAIKRANDILDDYHKWVGKFAIAVMLYVLALAVVHIYIASI